MSPIPIASVTFAPQPSSSLRAEGRLAAAGLARDEHALDARARGGRRALGEVGAAYDGVSTAASGRSRSIACTSRSVLPGADRDVAEADPVEGGERRAGDERARRCRSRRSAGRR